MQKVYPAHHTGFDHPKDEVNTRDYVLRVKWMGHMAEKINETTYKTYAYKGEY
jgi:hypothetical protein